jgi:hypothetical protein
MREAVDTPCRYVSNNDKTASGPATELDDLLPAGEVCTLFDAVPDAGAKVFEFTVPLLKVGHCRSTAIDLADGKPSEETGLMQSRRSGRYWRWGYPLLWRRCRNHLPLPRRPGPVGKDKNVSFVINCPRRQFREKALAEQRGPFYRRHVRSHISKNMIPYSQFVQNKPFTRLLCAVC